MASKSDQLLIVVSILEGRHFPKSPRHSLLVEARFDGEQLSTDPVEQREHPQFSTELAWELDRKTLHQHRLQRTPIKLQCYAVDAGTSAKESVGYIVLDLRSIQEVKQPAKWYPLLSSKYAKLKPALLLSMVLENDSKQMPEPFKAKKAPPRPGIELCSPVPHGKLKAFLNEEEGYHQIGPADSCTDLFVLSVTVAFAAKLEQLITSTTKISSEGSAFFFYYTLLGNDITSEPFQNLISPKFEPERASVRIRSSTKLIQAFLAQHSTLIGSQVHLCCGKHSLGTAGVPLSGLLRGIGDLDRQPTTVEGAFALHPPALARQALPPLPSDLQPTVGVSVSVRKEGQGVKVGPKSCHSEDAGLECASQDWKILGLMGEQSSTAEQRDPTPSPDRSPIPDQTESEAESLLEDAGQPAPQPSAPDAPAAANDPEGPASSVTVSAPKIAIPASAHHYCFSMDLRSVRSLNVTFPVNCTLRYAYQFFGSAAPIVTSPPVEVKRNTEVFLPRSYCAFDFAALSNQLQDTFLRVPLLVEMWHRDPSSSDVLLGTATVQLSHLLTAEKSRFVGPTGQQHWRQTFMERLPILSTQGYSPFFVTELCYVTVLEDLGFVKAQDMVVSESSQSLNPVRSKPAAPPPHGSEGTAEARDTLEYRAALELEMWKEMQESLFDDQLKKKELSHMQALAEEWRKRDREREALVKKKEMEYCLLEEQLQKTLADLEKREKHLAHAELELHREMRAGHESSMRDLQDNSRRLREDCAHQVDLERSKVRQLEEENARLQQQLSDAASRFKLLERDFQLFREQQHTRPEIQLQSEVNLLRLEKAELERKLESTTKSKLHYKQQWGRALKELARFKQREQENAMSRLKKQQQELEHMRLRYLAAEEKEAVKTEKHELEDIRNELNRLRQQQEEEKRALREPAGAVTPSDGAEERLSHLLEERDTLLRTGVYTHQDRIISELNRQIQEAIAQRAPH
uniref:Centrosomal protein of 120 kDa n=1 Tax=Denticeps clupeoides TaxID=299321 RepID=A0AAY4D0E6_9TELE